MTLDTNQSYAPTLRELIDLINSYWVDKFRDGDSDRYGWKKVFYNIVEAPTLISQNATDFDRSDVTIMPEEGKSYFPALFLSRKVRMYMKEKKMGSFFNKMGESLPKYGGVVVKRTKDGPQVVSWSNFYVRPNVNSLGDSEMCIEKHEEQPSVFKTGATKRGWKNIDEAIKKTTEGKPVTYYEAYGYFGDNPYNYCIVTDTGVVLHEDNYDSVSDLWRICVWDSIDGRILGRGQVEKLLEAQIQTNRVANYKSQGLHWSSKHLFQSRDQNVERNLLVDVENGDVINAVSEITPVGVEERNLSAYGAEEQRWDSLVARRTFSHDFFTGATPPAGTPFGTTALQTQMVGAYFERKREDIGLFLEDLFFDWIIPDVLKSAKKDKSMMLDQFSEDELSTIREAIISKNTNKAIVNYILRSGNVPDAQQVQLLKSVEAEKVKAEKEALINDGFYDNIKYKVKVVLTSEQVKYATQLTALQTVMGMIGGNPALMQDPRTKKMINLYLTYNGINPAELAIDETLGVEQVTAPRAGSIPNVGGAASPVMQTTQTQI